MPSTLLVTNDFGPRAGGIETFVIGLLERMPKGEVLVYTSNQPDAAAYDEKWLRDFGVKVIRDKSKILLPTPRVVRNLQGVVKSHSIKRVWFGAAAPLAISSRWLRKAGAEKIIALTHGHEVWWAKLWPFSWAISEIAKQADYVTYLGEFTKNALTRRFRDKEKLVRIAPGIDTNHFAPQEVDDLKAELNLLHQPIIVSVGRLVHRKGQDRLIAALPTILKEVPDAKLVFVGQGPHRKTLDKLVKKHGVADHVLFIGRITYELLPRYVNLGDIFAMPSRSRLFGLEVEGLGIVYLEASACGIPVVAGASGGAPDAVLEGETGFVVNGNDLTDIAAACIKLLKSKELRDRMGQQGRRWCQENWRWEIWSKQFNELLELGK